MPLSKARDRERKRKLRLESKNVQPNYVEPSDTPDNSVDIAYVDADGNPVYED